MMTTVTRNDPLTPTREDVLRVAIQREQVAIRVMTRAHQVLFRDPMPANQREYSLAYEVWSRALGEVSEALRAEIRVSGQSVAVDYQTGNILRGPEVERYRQRLSAPPPG
jgi:hypothetical protein